MALRSSEFGWSRSYQSPGSYCVQKIMAPLRQSYTKTTRQCKVSFNCNHCVGCPYQGQCRPKIDGWNATFITSKNASSRAKSQRFERAWLIMLKIQYLDSKRIKWLKSTLWKISTQRDSLKRPFPLGAHFSAIFPALCYWSYIKGLFWPRHHDIALTGSGSLSL